MEAEAIRLLIRSKLDDGLLPYDSMPRFWGGLGDGEVCDACDKPITKQQLVMEGIASVIASKKPVQFHVKCFYVWDAERRVAAGPLPNLGRGEARPEDVLDERRAPRP